MILADMETFGFGARLIFLIGLPAIGLTLNLVGWQRSGLNKTCAVAACIFFVTVLTQGMVATLTLRDAFNDAQEFWILAGTGVFNVLGGFVALLGLWQVRRKHRWPRGRKRAVFALWLNVLSLGLLGLHFFFKVHPEYDVRRNSGLSQSTRTEHHGAPLRTCQVLLLVGHAPLHPQTRHPSI